MGFNGAIAFLLHNWGRSLWADRDRSYLINEAISIYLEMHQWQVEEIQRGVSEADAGDFATEDEVNAVFARLTNGKVR